MRHVVMFSGGAGSWAAAKRVVEAHGAASTTLLFCDTRIEDAGIALGAGWTAAGEADVREARRELLRRLAELRNWRGLAA